MLATGELPRDCNDSVAKRQATLLKQSSGRRCRIHGLITCLVMSTRLGLPSRGQLPHYCLICWAMHGQVWPGQHLTEILWWNCFILVFCFVFLHEQHSLLGVYSGELRAFFQAAGIAQQ